MLERPVVVLWVVMRSVLVWLSVLCVVLAICWVLSRVDVV